ncbi:MAG: phospholipase D family protein [Pseudoxanthomonas sp.]
MSRWRSAGLLLACLLAGGCASLGPAQHARAEQIARQARSAVIDCVPVQACALDSPLRALGPQALAASAPQAPRHYALLLDRGEDSLLARLNLIRSAQRDIDLQTYIFDTDDSARLVLDALLAAARRGVKVRVLVDQLTALPDLPLLAALSGAHRNLELRIYNPTFNKAVPGYLDYAASVLCCFRRFNQRMHTKLLVVDGLVGISGGRNYQDDYFDWDGEYDFRDRDVLVAGPAAATMDASFEQFWDAPRSVPVEDLNDVGRTLLRQGVPALPARTPRRPARVAAMSAAADDAQIVRERLVARALPVGTVGYAADSPDKHRLEQQAQIDATAADWELRALLGGVQQELVIQTPYLILSKPARAFFEGLRRQPQPPQVIVSSNSLAAIDNPIVYSVSHKYKRLYLRRLGFQLYEYKPFPADAPVDYASMLDQPPLALPAAAGEDASTRAPDETAAAEADAEARRISGSRAPRHDVDRRLQRTENRPSFLSSSPSSDPLPLKRAGVRMGLHAKSMVIDGRIAVIGSHNFDPRSHDYNTEAVVVIPDRTFAEQLKQSIGRDIEPDNSWVIAPRPKPVLLSGLNYSLDKVSSSLPLFDLWPWRYATSWEFRPGPGCPAPVPTDDARFAACYRPVGDFPEVSLGPKLVYVRILMAFGAGLTPIL